MDRALVPSSLGSEMYVEEINLHDRGVVLGSSLKHRIAQWGLVWLGAAYFTQCAQLTFLVVGISFIPECECI